MDDKKGEIYIMRHIFFIIILLLFCSNVSNAFEVDQKQPLSSIAGKRVSSLSILAKKMKAPLTINCLMSMSEQGLIISANRKAKPFLQRLRALVVMVF